MFGYKNLSSAIFNNISHIIITVIIITITLWIRRFIIRQRKFSVLNKIPGPNTTFLFGNAFDFKGGSRDLFEVLVNKMSIYPGGITRMWIMNKPFVLIYGVSAVEALLNNSKNLKKGSDYDPLHSWLGNGLILSSETAMGRTFSAQDKQYSEYVNAVHDMGSIIGKKFSSPWLQYDFIFKRTEWGRLEKKSLEILHKLSLDTIRERKKEYKRLKSQKVTKEEDEVLGKKKRQAFLDMLIEYSEQNDILTEDDIREEVDTFMFGGHDTTSAAMNWAIYLLGRHPDIQEKVYEELQSIFGNSDRPASSDDVREMNYLECCIKESLRLLPSVPMITRHLTEDLTIDGYVIPKETDVIVVIYALHRDPQHFPDPLSFQPERFLPENSAKRNPYSYIPFSAGPRNCIGQKFALLEEKILLSSFFRKYRVESMEKFEDLKLISNLVLRTDEEMFVKIFPRKEE